MALAARPTKQFPLAYGGFRKTFNGLSQSDHLVVQLQRSPNQSTLQLWEKVRETSGIKSKRHMKKLLQTLQEHGLVRAVPPPAGSRDKLFVYKALNKGENKNIVVPEEIKPNPQLEWSKLSRLHYKPNNPTETAALTPAPNTEVTPTASSTKGTKQTSTTSGNNNVTSSSFSHQFLKQKIQEFRAESRKRPTKAKFLRAGLVKIKSKQQLKLEAEELKRQQRAKAKAAEVAKKEA